MRVSTHITGIPELIRNGVDGLLVAPSDLDGLVAALAKLMDDPALRERMGKSARARVMELYDLRRNVLKGWQRSLLSACSRARSFDTYRCAKRVRSARPNTNGIIGGVGRFDAQHVHPVAGGHVRHSRGLLDPRIPDYGARRAAFLDDDAPVPNRVMKHTCGRGSQVHLIGFLSDLQ